ESFGARLTLKMDDPALYAKDAEAIFQSLKIKQDLLKVTLRGILIGDKIYDTYLRMHNLSTVDLKDERLLDIIRLALAIFHASERYLEKTKVVAYFVDDPSYISSGILSRMMFAKNVPTYVSVWGSEFWLLRSHPATSPEEQLCPVSSTVHSHYMYPILFSRLSDGEKEAGILKGREALEKRLSGAHCPFIQMPKSPYANGENTDAPAGPILANHNGRPKILVMLHDFIDCPHSYRHMLFPDFKEWITFLLEKAEKTPFSWYVKPHPFASSSSRKVINAVNSQIIEDLKKQFPKVTFIPGTANNQQILKEGISSLFTVHGTVAHEFAYCGVPVVNAGDNPHSEYNFNFHAKTIEEYTQFIENADKLKIEIDKTKIEEFAYMNYFYFQERFGSRTSLVDISELTDEEKGQITVNSEIYPKLLSGITPDKEQHLQKYLKRYFEELESKQNR
ncbi:MAG: hypothetical protein ABI443_09330, partial [Chthoniobacterales bacterium]